MDLDEAIAQLVNLGEKDPLTIARKLASDHGEEWVRDELLARSEDLLALLARAVLGSQRRSAEMALQPGNIVATSELKLRSYWVPDEGWKRANELTRDDLLARAHWYDLIAHASSKRAAWLRRVVDLMDKQGVSTLGDVHGELPPLDDDGPLGLAA